MTSARGLRRATATPTRHIAPPTYATVGGVSARNTQLSSTVIGGTRYVVTLRLLAVM